MDPNLIKIPTRLLRRVDVASQSFDELCQSIQQYGVLQPVLVRSGSNELLDGLHRTLACRRLGCDCPTTERSVTDDEALLLQLIPNIHRTPVDRVDVSRHLLRLRTDKHTFAELCQFTGKSASWIREQLQLAALPEVALKALADGSLKVRAALQLARLPQNEIPKWLPLATQMPMDEFTGRVSRHIADQRNGHEPRRNSDPEHPVLRSKREIVARLRLAEGDFKNALEWVLQIDPESLAFRRKRCEARGNFLRSKPANKS